MPALYLTVYDAATMAALPGAKVALDGIIRYTDNDGKATFNLTPTIVYMLTVSKTGYQSKSQTVAAMTYDVFLSVGLTPIAPTKIPTALSWVVTPPANVHVGDTVHMSLMLKDVAGIIHWPLGGKPINLIRNRQLIQTKDTAFGLPDGVGVVVFDEVIGGVGAFEYYGEFEGDETYEGCVKRDGKKHY